MKKMCAVLVVAMVAVACSPKVKTAVLKKDVGALGQSDAIVVIDEDKPAPSKGILVGRIRAADTGFTVNCSYPEMIEHIRAKAKSVGANVIKISDWQKPNGWSTCDRISADLYRVDNIGDYEAEIAWTPTRKLTWEDFKKAENNYPSGSSANAAAVSSCGIGVTSARKGLFSAQAFVVAVFYANDSWVRADAKNPAVLIHEQAHFDLAELYARKMRKVIKEAGKEGVLLAGAVHQRYYAEYVQRQTRYDMETQHGIDAEAQQQWLTTIEQELNDLKEHAWPSPENLATP
ncbi:hypothetical protein SAMN04488109_4757 [Chryseolinea serpens]|uniref:DUF922 domain-containing protein n=1 Tax=Chryseolinea serpens TaxID=947013 RepID=A0A1M5UKY0_9BACT|nr:hypothetical protein [Chryseolinea serpens]SHH63712.1 hypothetical protein SAMN04488109_4757 [Chryseolinea serpens]